MTKTDEGPSWQRERAQEIAAEAAVLARTCTHRLLALIEEPGEGERAAAEAIGKSYAQLARWCARLLPTEPLNGAGPDRLREVTEGLAGLEQTLAYGGNLEVEGEWSSFWNLHELILAGRPGWLRTRKTVPRRTEQALVALATGPGVVPDVEGISQAVREEAVAFGEAFLDLGTDDGSLPIATYARVVLAQARAYGLLAVAHRAMPALAERTGRRLPMATAAPSPALESLGGREQQTYPAVEQPSGLDELLGLLRSDAEESDDPDDEDEADHSDEQGAATEGEERTVSPVERLAEQALASWLQGSMGWALDDPELSETLTRWGGWLLELGKSAVQLLDVVDEMGRPVRLPAPAERVGIDAVLSQAEGDLQILLATGGARILGAVRQRLGATTALPGALSLLYAGDAAASQAAPAPPAKRARPAAGRAPAPTGLTALAAAGLEHAAREARRFLERLDHLLRATQADAETFAFHVAVLHGGALSLHGRVLGVRALLRLATPSMRTSEGPYAGMEPDDEPAAGGVGGKGRGKSRQS